MEKVFSFLDETNPGSLINIVPKIMVEPIKELAIRAPSYIGLGEKQLREKIEYTGVDDRLRLTFWDEFHNATMENRRMLSSRFINVHTCTIEVFVREYLRRPGAKLAFVITPPRKYTLAMRHLLEKGVERIEEIMNLPITKADGTPNTTMISQILKAFALIDLRVKGAIVQKMQIQQQNLNLNADVSASDTQMLQNLASMSMEDLEKLERKVAKLATIEAQTVNTLPLEEQVMLRDMKDDLQRKETVDVPEDQ